jgi:hypothetical protein
VLPFSHIGEIPLENGLQDAILLLEASNLFLLDELKELLVRFLCKITDEGLYSLFLLIFFFFLTVLRRQWLPVIRGKHFPRLTASV